MWDYKVCFITVIDIWGMLWITQLRMSLPLRPMANHSNNIFIVQITTCTKQSTYLLDHGQWLTVNLSLHHTYRHTQRLTYACTHTVWVLLFSLQETAAVETSAVQVKNHHHSRKIVLQECIMAHCSLTHTEMHSSCNICTCKSHPNSLW